MAGLYLFLTGCNQGKNYLKTENRNYSFPQSNTHATHRKKRDRREVLLRKTFKIQNPKFLLY